MEVYLRLMFLKFRWADASGPLGICGQQLEVGRRPIDAAERGTQLDAHRAHLLGDGPAVRTEPQLAPRTGEHTAPVADDDHGRQGVEDPQIGGISMLPPRRGAVNASRVASTISRSTARSAASVAASPPTRDRANAMGTTNAACPSNRPPMS